MNKNKNFIVLSIFIYLAIFISLGILEIFLFSTDLSKVQTAEFWITNFFKSLLTFGAYFATALNRYALLDLTEIEYNEIETSIKKHRVKLIDDSFRGYINSLNKAEKTSTWQNKISSKLTKHVSRISKRVSRDMLKNEHNNYKRYTVRYLKKEARLKEWLTTEWIDKNLRFKKIKYPEVLVSEVINGSTSTKTSRSRLTRNPLSSQIYSKVIIVFVTILLNGLLALLVFDGTKDIGVLLAKLLLDLVMIGTNVFAGFLAANQAHKTKIVTATERLEIIFAYLKTLNENKNIIEGSVKVNE